MIRILDSASPHSGVGKYVRELFASPHLAGRLEHVRLDRSRGAAVLRPGYDEGEGRIVARLPARIPPAWWSAACSALVPASPIVHATHQNLPGARGAFRIVTVHDLFYATHPRGLADRILARTLYPFLPRYDRFLCDSGDSADGLQRLLRIPASRIQVVPLVVDIPDPSRIVAPDPSLEGRRYVLHVSSEEPRKNFATLLRAFAALVQHPNSSDLLLVKVGRAAKASSRQEHLALAHELGIADRLRILEGISDEHLCALYSHASAMAMPSESEGFGYPLAEAMAVGCPSIAGDCPALREIGGDLVPYAPPREPRAWTELLEAALEEPSGSPERARRIERARLFSRQAFGERMKVAYGLGA